jgi:hypothetical protein
MAINQITVLPIVTGALTSNGIVGVSMPQLALALTNGLVQYVLTGITITSQDVGTVGSGVGTGFGISLEVPILFQNFQTTFTAAGINGTHSRLIINAISTAYSSVFRIANMVTTNVGVAVGTGVVSVIPNTIISIPTYIGNFTASLLLGISAPALATAIAKGLDQSLPTAKGTVIIAGPPSSTSSTGNGLGKIL